MRRAQENPVKTLTRYASLLLSATLLALDSPAARSGKPAHVDLTWMSIDTATWSKLTGAPIIGSRSTCFQSGAENVPTERCTAVYGGEKISLAQGVTMHVIRWNHSGGPAVNWEQHDPVDLHVPIVVDGVDYGAPIDNPRAALTRAGLSHVDLWIGTG